jgi:ankyrin repeat protein
MNPEAPTSKHSRQPSAWLLVLIAAGLGGLIAFVQNAFRIPEDQWALREGLRHQLALNSAILSGQSADEVRQAVENGANLWVGMHDGSSPFLYAITLGRIEAIEVMLDHVADLEQAGRYSASPGRWSSAERSGPALFAALDCDQPTDVKIKMFNLLLARGANVHRESGGATLMDLAAFRGDEAIGDLLREHGLPYGPREMAALNLIKELEQAIQESPALLRERVKPMGLGTPISSRENVSTLLGIAVAKKHRKMARMLVEAGAPVDAVESLGLTPLHIAAAYANDAELIRLLIAHGADVNAVDDKQWTPLASIRGAWKPEDCEAAVDALLEAGAR